MKRLHLFYLSALLLVWVWGTYRQCQWSGTTAEPAHQGAILALQHSHQALLWEMQQGAQDYPSPQAAFYTRRAVTLDSLLRLFDSPVGLRIGKEEAIWRDSIWAFLDEDEADNWRWLALDTLSARTHTWTRVKKYLLQDRANQYLATKIVGHSISCWFGFKPNVFPAENLLLEGDTLHAEVGELRFSKGNEKIWVNGQRLAGQDGGVDSVFTTPGWHTIDVQVVTLLPYGMRHEARRQYKLYVLNHSK